MAEQIVKSTLAGVISSIEVVEGESVTAKQNVVILEVMKMLIPVEAPTAGRVRSLHVRAGEVVAEGQSLFTLDL